MALSFVTYTGTGTQTQFAVTFPYISKLHVFVFVDGASVSFVWVNNSLIQTTVAPLSGTFVELRRDTPVAAPLVDFEDGGTLSELDLDLMALQALYTNQEQADDIANSMKVSFDQEWDAQSLPMKNLADPATPTSITDAINLGFLNTALVGSGNVPVPLDPDENDYALIAGSGVWAWGQLLVASISDIIDDLKTFLTSADLATARTNLGLGSAAVEDTGTASDELPLNSDLGSASIRDTGVLVNQIPLLEGPGMPAVEGGQMKFTAMINPINFNKGSNIASATTTDIGAATGNFVDVTGTTTITGLGTIQAGTMRWVRFLGALLITHHATALICLGGADITTVAGDVAEFTSLGSGNWVMTDYRRKTGGALIGSPTTFRGALVTHSAALDIVTSTLTSVTWNTETYDTDTIHDNSTNPERLTVPAGVTRVRLSANVQWEPSTAGNTRQIFISKNGDDGVYDGRANISGGKPTTVNYAQNCHSAVLIVAEDDYFICRVQHDVGSNLEILQPNSWFSMEIIQ